MAELATNPQEPYVPVVIQEHLFRHDLRRERSKPGLRVTEILQEHDLPPDQIHALVSIDGSPVEQAYWHLVKPKAGHLVTVRVIPQGGGSGNTGKDVLRIVAMVGVLALAIAAPMILPALVPALGGIIGPMTVGGMLLTAGITIGGSVRLLSLIPSSPQLIGDR